MLLIAFFFILLLSLSCSFFIRYLHIFMLPCQAHHSSVLVSCCPRLLTCTSYIYLLVTYIAFMYIWMNGISLPKQITKFLATQPPCLFSIRWSLPDSRNHCHWNIWSTLILLYLGCTIVQFEWKSLLPLCLLIDWSGHRCNHSREGISWVLTGDHWTGGKQPRVHCCRGGWLQHLRTGNFIVTIRLFIQATLNQAQQQVHYCFCRK